MAARQYAQKEWKLLSWWLATFHPNADIWMNVKLGPTLRHVAQFPDDPSAGETLRVRNRWGDAVLVEHGRPAIIEAKIEPEPGIFSTLIHYLRKFRLDPAWSRFAGVPVDLIALVYHDDPSVSIEASWYGVRWIVYQPALAEFPPAAQRLQAMTSGESPLPHDWPARLRSWGVSALNGS